MTKKLMTFVVILIAGLLSVAKADDDRRITIAQLPSQAQLFIKSNFRGKNVAYVTKDRDGLRSDYEVKFKDGSSIDFDHNGRWTDIESRSLPSKLVPGQIRSYVAKNHPGQKVVKISRERSGYDIELSDDTDLEFNKNFHIVEIDD